MVVHPASNGISRVPPYSRAPRRASSTVAYGTLTRSGRPFQQRSASRLVCIALCWACRPNSRVVQPHAGSGGSLAVTDMVWAAPGSLTATTGILSFPRGTEMFQFPRLPPHTLVYSGAGLRVSPRRGCPIRTPSDHRLPAAPRGVSSPGHVLLRPQTPRHPPCARHANPSILHSRRLSTGTAQRASARSRSTCQHTALSYFILKQMRRPLLASMCNILSC
jgi:hypothetical protein